MALAYYDGSDNYGLAGDIKTATVQNWNGTAWENIGTTMYRWYTGVESGSSSSSSSSSSSGAGGVNLPHLARFVLDAEAYDRLAADPDTQLRYLDAYSPLVDEIVLDFDDVARAAEDMFSCGESDTSQLAAIRQVEQWLDRMDSDKSTNTWSREALATSSAWAHLRLLARQCLETFR